METKKARHLFMAFSTLTGIALLAGCSTTAKAPDVTESISSALKQAGLKDVSVAQDRDKGVVTLKGTVPAEGDKAQAGSLAKSLAGNQIVANEIAVVPPGAESAAKTVNGDLDDAIKKNLDASLIQNSLHDDVTYDVKNGVVTLSGSVNSEGKRTLAQQAAAAVPNVQQVVNAVEVKNRKATSTP